MPTTRTVPAAAAGADGGAAAAPDAATGALEMANLVQCCGNGSHGWLQYCLDPRL